ncbi:MAG: hypothetical protein WC728_06145 [Elusimicrobiota bacterium]
MKRMHLAMLVGMAVLLTGCVSSIKKYPYGMMNTGLSLNSLARDQYEILSDVEGRASASQILFFKFTEGGNKSFSGSLASGRQEFLMGGADPVIQAALYNAMESQPDADGIVAVRVIKGEQTVVPLLFKKITVTLKGKAIKVKKG